MSNKIGPRCANGEVEGTGAKISIVCGFRPAAVLLYNVDGEVELAWNRSMAADSGYKKLGISSGANANESSHTHAVALDSGDSGAGSSHSHAHSLAVNSGTVAVTGVAASAGTPSGSNASSDVAAVIDVATPRLNGTGYATVGQDVTTTENFTCDANEFAGMYLIADGLPATAPVLILSNTAAADAPVVFTVAGIAPATDAGTWRVFGILGVADAQVFSGNAMGDHVHADTAVLSDLSLSGSISDESAHTHGPGSLADVASGAGSAHTHVFSGGASEAEFITSGGISSRWDGFDIGTDSDVNVAAETLYWVAWRF